MVTGRLAGPSDLETVRQITVAAYRDYAAVLDRDPLPVTEDYAPRIAAGQVWLVVHGENTVGTMVIEREVDHLLVFSLAVLPECKGAGVGRWMLNYVDELARAAGLNEIRLYTNPLMVRNIRIYGEHGYVETGRRPNPYRPGWVFVDMAKRV